MNGLNDIQIRKIPVRLKDAGCGNAPGVQLLIPNGTPCQEQWEKARDKFQAACAERDGKKHHVMLMEAGHEFVQVVLAPGHHPIEKSFALNNIGLIMQALNQLDAAMKSFGFALTMNPNNATILNNYATIRMIQGETKEAADYFWKALEKDPKCAEARWNSALIALLFGDFRKGWLNYEARWKCGTFTWRDIKTSKPKWKGQDLKGKTILLTHEQGFGDSIMFIRYAKMVKARGAAKVRFLCPPELECILKDVEGIDSVTVLRDINLDGSVGDDDFDYHCPLLTLPKIFKTFKEKDIPAEVPYIRVTPPAALGAFPRDLVDSNGKLRVGIVWAGRAQHANDANRSISIKEFEPLFSLPNCIWYSLQFGDRAYDVKPYTNVYAPPLKSFADTAWWLANLDLLISVDTAVVHLAGAMARPTWALIPHAPDWRWMFDREDSPWYPTVKLIRQSTKGQWGDVIERVKGDLCKKTESNSQ